ncbi:MAG: carbohydrate ABC transporter permease [Clostridiales bacterium]|nr:carbohydrate ABC transporter permease [Clostridiales bacterium]
MIALLVLGTVNLYPLFFALLGSFASQKDILEASFLPVPSGFSAALTNFSLLFSSRTFVFSILLTVGKILFSFVVTVFVSVLAGYVFAKVRFVGKRYFFLLLVSSMMIPGVAMFVSNYIWMAKFPLAGGNDILGRGGTGFINNPAIHFVTGWVNVYNIFLCRQAFASLGDEMNESAQIDGAGFFRVVFTIYMPLILPVLAVMFLNNFIGIWNDYMTNLIFLPTKGDWHTVGSIFVTVMTHFSEINRNGGPIYAVSLTASVVSMIPAVVVYIFVQKQFTEGLTMGAVKG